MLEGVLQILKQKLRVTHLKMKQNIQFSSQIIKLNNIPHSLCLRTNRSAEFLIDELKVLVKVQ
jgi:hypothetical protein